jgi:hypothetical protein
LRPDDLAKLADVLGTTTDELLGKQSAPKHGTGPRNDNHTSGVTTITHPWSGEACGLT